MHLTGYMVVSFGLSLSLLAGLSASLQCQAFCRKDQAQNFRQFRNDTIITFCQLWEDKDALIDPAIELGIQSLRDSFPPNVHFEWIKMELPGGCSNSDETSLLISPAAVELNVRKSSFGCSVFMGPACTASVEQIRGLLSSWNIPVLTTEAGGITGNQKAASKLLTRLGFNQEAVGLFLVKVLEYFSWTNIVIVSSSFA
ncbi:hypothetical protein RvY_04651-2 [Ramazzottius varieornatus]|uniref:Receptor ligand binding region domain-containing protein n=1 Tax=Ramazzottius varieornatus TaxID=947166 RepID=A0A1D1UVN1_RAMVA|nr:hypothetical protein RvY_04651-2 [Ramazzottius varieornatus]